MLAAVDVPPLDGGPAQGFCEAGATRIVQPVASNSSAVSGPPGVARVVGRSDGLLAFTIPPACVGAYGAFVKLRRFSR